MKSPVFLLLCLIAAGGAGPDADPLPIRLGTIDGESVDVGLREITPAGRIRYDREGADVALEDVLRLAPKNPANAGSRPRPGLRAFHLADGGLLMGRMLPAEDAAERALRVDLSGGTVVTIPFDGLAAVRTATELIDEVEAEFRQRIESRRPGRDLMIIARAGRAVVVPGSLERLGPDGWEFRFGSRTRSAGLDAVYGFVLGAPPLPPKPLPATLLMRNGDRFTARIRSADAASLVVDAGPLGRLTLPWSAIRLIDRRSDRIVCLSSLEPDRTVQRSLPGASWPPRRDTNVTGGPLRLASRSFARGIGVHAYTALSYHLDGAYERFSAVVGIDDSVAPYGSVVFRVRVDGRPVCESPILRAGQAPLTLSADLRGADRLTLECDVGDDLDLSDHADWANAMLIRARDGKPR